jgi:hypothetical protein
MCDSLVWTHIVDLVWISERKMLARVEGYERMDVFALVGWGRKGIWDLVLW